MVEMIPEGILKGYATDILKASEKGAVIIQDLLTWPAGACRLQGHQS